jgi:serine/threonine protein kinase
MLCLQNCVVDSNWIVKLTNFVTEWLISDKIRHNEIRRDDSIGQINRRDTLLETEPEILNDSSESIETQPQTYRSILDDADESTYKSNNFIKFSTLNLEIIQQAPEIIREIVSTKFIPHGSPAADIYSLGMVLYQILFKLEPFHEYEMEYSKILEKLATTDENVEIMRPTFPNQNSADESEAYSLELISTIDTCWLESPEARPNSKHIKTIVTESFKSK